MLKILFLDIDGVLNNEMSNTIWLCGPENYGLDENNINIVKRIISATNCKIVWITSWRKHPLDFVWNFNKYVRFNSPFSKARSYFQGMEYDKCPIAPHVNGNDKSGDIAEWTKINRPDIVKLGCRFAILDDQSDQGLDFYNESFFKTSTKTGVTDLIANQVITHLNFE